MRRHSEQSVQVRIVHVPNWPVFADGEDRVASTGSRIVDASGVSFFCPSRAAFFDLFIRCGHRHRSLAKPPKLLRNHRRSSVLLTTFAEFGAPGTAGQSPSRYACGVPGYPCWWPLRESSFPRGASTHDSQRSRMSGSETGPRRWPEKW